MRGALLHQVNQAPWRGNKDVNAASQRLNLRVVRHAAHHGEDAMMRVVRDGAAHLADLLGKLARGRDHQHQRPLVALRVPQLVHGRQRERGRFARARFRGGNKVAPLKHVGDSLLLHGRRVGVSQLGHSLQRLAGQAKFVEMRHIWFVPF